MLQDLESNSRSGGLSTGQAGQGGQAHGCHLPVALPASLETGSRLLPEEQDQVSRAAVRLARSGASSSCLLCSAGSARQCCHIFAVTIRFNNCTDVGTDKAV